MGRGTVVGEVVFGRVLRGALPVAYRGLLHAWVRVLVCASVFHVVT